MQNLIESKSLLAKLMATENLVVEQKNVPTAMFDVKNRILTVPVLDDKITGYEYDLFMGHEVGHALYTPVSGILKAYEQKIPGSILNVVEDVRIERKIKFKYPGLRSSFIRAYNGLYGKDFFGTDGVDLNELNFVDRLNLYSKVGVSLGIKFSDFEKELLTAAETTETYDDVIEVAKRIVDYMKEKEEERKAMMPEEDEEDPDVDYDSDGQGDNYDDFSEEGESEDDSGDGQHKAGKSDDEEEQTEQSSGDEEFIDGDDRYNYKPVENDNIRAFTDEAFKQNEKKLFAENAKNWVYANVPKIKSEDVIMGYKELYKKYKDHYSHTKIGFDTKNYQKIRKETNKVVSYLAKEFELRKNAEQLKRVSIAKTGKIDMKKVFSYKFSEDIFKKISVVPNGKSHGLVMFLDWSGSMSNHLDNTIKQLISLVMFCKKVNIPYEVYAFATQETHTENYRCEPKENDIFMGKFQLLNLLSNKMTASEFSYAASVLVYLANNPRYCPNWMCLGGTPLNEAVVSAMDIIPKFQKQYRLQIVNSVFLTDGEGHSNRTIYVKDDKTGQLTFGGVEFGWGRQYPGLVLRDPITKYEERIENIYNSSAQTGAYVKLLKARTGCNVLGFYVIGGREFGKKCYDFFPRSANYDEIKAKFRKNKYAVVTNAGFDEYYILRSEALDTDEDNEFVVKENATTRGLVSAFSKYAGGRIANRVVLNRFIGLIS